MTEVRDEGIFRNFLFSVHPKTFIFGFMLSAFSIQLSAKDLNYRMLADR